MLNGRITSAVLVATLGVAPPLMAQRAGGPANADTFPTPQQWAASKETQAHVARAMEIGRADLANEAKAFCTPTGPQRVALARQAQGLPPIPTRPIGPIKVFDNLYYLGFNDVGAWVVPTSAGLILFDTLNSTADATNVIEAGLRQVGLDPSQIKYIVLGHGHQDHTGGASYLQMKYAPKVLMAAPDWAMVARNPRPDRPQPTHDMDLTDGQTLTLGDTTVTLVQLPGHTPGTVGMIVPAKFGGQTHGAFIMSGSQMPTAQSLAAFAHVFNDFAKPARVEAVLGSHPDILMNSLVAMEGIRDRYPTSVHPFLGGAERAARYLDIVIECGRGRLAALEQPRTTP